MIRHCAFFKFNAEVSKEAANALMREFMALKNKIDGVIDLQAGENVSPEGLDQGFTYGIVMDFVSPDARDAYLAHPDHVELATRVIERLEGGLGSGVVAFDLMIG